MCVSVLIVWIEHGPVVSFVVVVAAALTCDVIFASLGSIVYDSLLSVVHSSRLVDAGRYKTRSDCLQWFGVYILRPFRDLAYHPPAQNLYYA